MKKQGKEKNAKAVVVKLATELSDLSSMEGKHMKPLSDATIRAARGCECVSIGESKAIKFAKAEWPLYAVHNSKRFVRVYPGGARIDSSNYHPQLHWNAGCQIVALNWQSTTSYELRLNKGRFADNGNCGYLLKPDYLRCPPANGAKVDRRGQKRVSVEVLSGFNLPKPDGATEGEVVDPYVKVFVEGPEIDVAATQRSTHTIDDNGFHPVWATGPQPAGGGGRKASDFAFDVPVPALSTLVLQVFDKDIDADDFLAECFVPVSRLRQGVRRVPLRTERGRLLPTSFLMVHVAIDDASHS